MHGCKLALWMLFVGVATAAAGPPGPVVLVLRPEATVAQAAVRIADVAELRGGDELLRRQLAALDLAVLTAERAELRLPRQQLAFRMQLAGFPATAFRLEGAEHSVVRWQVPQATGEPAPLAIAEPESEISAADVTSAALAHLQSRLPWPAEQVQLQLSQPVILPAVNWQPDEPVRLQAELPAHSQLAGRVRVDVALYAQQERRAIVPVYFDVQLQGEVAVAKRRIEAGETLNADNLHADRRAINSRAAVPTYQECLAGQRAKRVLAPGQVLVRTDLDVATAESPVLIRPRDLLRIVTRVGAMQISTSGEALQEGKAGQIIRVRNTSSNRIIQARVVERGIVEVGF